MSPQIVESAQVDPDDAEQQRILGSSTHFNPVDLVCGVRGTNGEPRPGLWNGAMAEWNTVFVEVPIETFSPVKTVLDLLREEHQP